MRQEINDWKYQAQIHQQQQQQQQQKKKHYIQNSNFYPKIVINLQ